MNKHTPGPWVVLDTSSNGIIVSQMLLLDRTPQFICEGFLTEADAHLVAAAPDMLDALKKLHALYSDHSRTSFDLVEIRAILETAISKAAGKS